MIIRLTTCIVSQDWNYKAGDAIEIEDKAATRLIEAGFAKPVKATKATRTATAPQPPVETTSEAK